MKRVLFLCVHNPARSQIAEAYLRKIAGDSFQLESAGLEPGTLTPSVVTRVLTRSGREVPDLPGPLREAPRR